jgi:hypothetical protein
MDIDRLARQVSEQLTARPTRRGIVSAVAKLGAGVGVVLASLRHPGDAAAAYCPVAGSCCSGACPITDASGTTTYPQSACDAANTANTGKCPTGYKKRYQWFCNNGETRQLCLDCYNSSRNYGCTVATTR